MKKFDALKWIRKVRDDHHEQQRNLTAEQKIKQTETEADAFRAFRASRPDKNVSTRKD